MATAADEEIEYESDPEEAKLSLKMRRREASDDEADEGSETSANPPRRVEIEDSDVESEGAPADYEDEYEEDYDLDEEYAGGIEVVKATADDSANTEIGEINEESVDIEDGQNEGEKKEIEPFAVPTAGAFYMHDDRFRGTPRGRNRRMLGGRKLWESKDDMKWGHDKFEELTVQERGYNEHRRGSRGRNRGRGRNRAAVHGFAQGNRPRELTNNGTQNKESQSNVPKSFRGRGPRMYQPLSKNKVPITQKKQSGKPNEKPSYANYEGASGSMSNEETDVAFPRKQAFASNLNVASPPFYPSGSSTKVNNIPNKRDVQADTVKGGSYTTAQSSGRKNSVGSIGVDKLYINESVPVNTNQQQLRGRGRGVASSNQMYHQPVVSNNQVSRVNPSVQSRAQSFAQASGQQFRLQSSSPPKATGAVNPVESAELEALSEPNKSKTVLFSKEKGAVQGSGRGSFLFGGTQVMGASGNMASGHGDPNFPAFLPMMQFSGQHPGGMGVPAVGMAYPGYVAQPQLGRGNSEMTWLPVLANAAGALGARYPYIAVDGSYHARPSGQISSVTAASSKENNTTNAGNEWEPAQRPELANDELGQRQKNPRRYTKMIFDQ